jgi:hypothetical protein
VERLGIRIGVNKSQRPETSIIGYYTSKYLSLKLMEQTAQKNDRLKDLIKIATERDGGCRRKH